MNPRQSQPIPFHRPAIADREIAAAVEVMRSGWLTTGPKAHALESGFAERLGARHALAVNSATAALHLALEAIGVGTEDEIVVPTYTFTACGEVCDYLGARVVLTDVDADGLIGAEQVQKGVTDRTRAVMPVHLGGMSVDVEALRQVAPAGIRFLEDAAHALPADLHGVPVGRLGDAAAFSFYATKTMTTGGEGGMLVTDDDAIAERARLMRLHGISTDAWNRYGGGSWAYEVAEAGFKYNMTDLAAAIGLVQLERLDELARARTSIAARYDRAFAGSPLLAVPPRHDGDRHAWHLYAVRLNLEALSIGRAEVMQQLAAAGIGASVHFIPLHFHPHYQRRYGYAPGDFPVAERIFERSISLPIWPGMTTEMVDRVSSTLLAICDSAKLPTQM